MYTLITVTKKWKPKSISLQKNNVYTHTKEYYSATSGLPCTLMEWAQEPEESLRSKMEMLVVGNGG